MSVKYQNHIHPEEESLRAFGLGLLKADELTAVEAHIADCQTCCEILDGLDEDPFVERVNNLLRSNLPDTICKRNQTTENETFTLDSGRGDSPTKTILESNFPGYGLISELGSGGMGVVYEARHLRLNRVVALKWLKSGTRAEPEEVLRFRKEAETLARLHHPGIVQVFDVDSKDGLPFFTMELLKGGSLADRISVVPLPAKKAAHCVEQLARAVAAAHQQGVVHRDLKPSNVLFAETSVDQTSDTNQPKISDFGLAKWLDQDLNLTQTGTVAGTPAFMAPEQARGEIYELGPAVDIYALGAVLYTTLTGRPPFLGDSPLVILNQVCEAEPIPPGRIVAGLSRDLETICLKRTQTADI